MNMRQKQYVSLMQMLETIQAELSQVHADVESLHATVDRNTEVALVLNTRLIFAGQALIGKTAPGFNENAREKFRYGLPE